MTMLATESFLRRKQADPRQSLQCPRCSQSFIAENAVVWCVYYHSNDGQMHYGPVLFCGNSCVLEWHGLEVAHA